MTTIREEDFVTSVADAFQFISYYHPADYIRDLWAAMAGPSAAAPIAVPRRPDDVSWFALSPTRARIHLAWAPWTDLALGVRSLS